MAAQTLFSRLSAICELEHHVTYLDLMILPRVLHYLLLSI